jgi:glycosyltransferase involved in cell wall biosynthesis
MPMERIRVLHVLTSVQDRFGGPSVSMLPMARALAREPDLEVSVFTVAESPSDGEPRTVEEGGVRLTYFPTPALPALRRRLISPKLTAAVWRRRGEFDIVQSHGIFTFVTASSDATNRLLGRAYVMRPCGVFAPWCLAQGSSLKRPFLTGVRPLLRSAAFVHCTSEAEAEDVRRIQPRARTRVIPLGVDWDGAAHNDTSPNALEPEGPYVLFLGRLHRIKGLDLLLDAFVELVGVHPGLQLILAGPDEGMREPVTEAARRRGVLPAVRFTGLVVGAAKRRLLAGARCLVLPSYEESFGVVVIEAAAMGTPVVVSTGVALHSEVEASGAGAVAELNVTSIATRLGEVLARPRQAYAEGCARLAARFSWERTARTLSDAYREVLATRAQRG